MRKPDKFKYAYYRSIPAFFNEETDELIGRNWLYDKLIDLNIFIDTQILQIDHFPILIEK